MNERTPKFSIIMPAYNAEQTIGRAVASVLAQTESNFELIIINDGSTDKTDKIINKFLLEDARIIYLKSEINHGVYYGRNLGIKKARGRYIAFLDSDDYWLSNKLELQNELLQAGYSVVYSAYYRELPSKKLITVQVPTSTDFSALLKGNCIANSTGVYDSHAVGKVYQKNIGHEDFLMWLDILRITNSAKGINTPLAHYTASSQSLSSNPLRGAKWTWLILRREINLPFHKATLNFLSYAISAVKKRL